MGGLLKVYPRREFELSWVYLVRFPSQQAGEKTQFDAEKRPPGLKPIRISRDLRGPEGPLFHGDAYILEFFSSLLGEVPLQRLSPKFVLPARHHQRGYAVA